MIFLMLAFFAEKKHSLPMFNLVSTRIPKTCFAELLLCWLAAIGTGVGDYVPHVQDLSFLCVEFHESHEVQIEKRQSTKQLQNSYSPCTETALLFIFYHMLWLTRR